MRKLSTDEFIEKAKAIHGTKYDYSCTVYTTSMSNVKIICPIHGEFEQRANGHLNGKGCIKCGIDNKKSDQLEIIEKMKKIHNNFYDYSLFYYVNMVTKSKIICPIHGEFEQRPESHLAGRGCSKCKNSKNNLFEIFLKKANILHNNYYKYKKETYIDSTRNITVICPIHGEFEQLPSNHLAGAGCLRCNHDKNRKPLNKFIEEANLIHNNFYDYSKSEYIKNNKKIKIICPIHGEFSQRPIAHLNGHKCKKCAILVSKFETDICDILTDSYITGDRNLIKPLELDIVLENKRIAIECDGLYFHSEKYGKDKNYHLNKTNMCESIGYQLIHIFEDEWIYKPKIVRSRLQHILGNTRYKIYARKCEIYEIDNNYYNKFIDKYHIQGSVPAKIKLGLFYKKRLVAVMSFSKPRFNKKYEWELLRYCSINNFSIIGGASKLLSYFKKNYQGSIISYADRRWSTGSLYEQLGFKYEGNSTPAYFYTKGNTRYNRVKFQKHKLSKLLSNFDETLTEHENMFNNHYFKIWDCGNKIYTLNNEN